MKLPKILSCFVWCRKKKVGKGEMISRKGELFEGKREILEVGPNLCHFCSA